MSNALNWNMMDVFTTLIYSGMLYNVYISFDLLYFAYHLNDLGAHTYLLLDSSLQEMPSVHLNVSGSLIG